ncbi:MAG: glucose/arabinose dehydrogenase [Halieaceae bacterium]|jgi:glucose/arabinose dehydrogenase
MRKVWWLLGTVVSVLVLVPLALIATGTIGAYTVETVLYSLTGYGLPSAAQPSLNDRYKVPDGFSVSLYAPDLRSARLLRFTPNGDLLVSRPSVGDVVVLHRDEDGDGVADGMSTLLSDLRKPRGLDLVDGWLYVAESTQVGRVRYDAQNRALAGSYTVIIDGLTGNGGHGQKSLRIGPDKKLYLSQGSTCNVCVEEDERRATMTRFDLDGGNPELIATGLRNTVGFDWAPWSGELYGTDNGRDMLGDEFPPCELNRIVEGKFYGWPYFNGDNVPDPDMGSDPLAGKRSPTAPVHDFRAHNAPLGMRFIDGAGLPPAFARSALVALHGSWNRSEADGYKVVSLHFSGEPGEERIEERSFFDGLLVDGTISGRPVDVTQGPDGAIYISDDYAGAIYRVSYTGE